MNHYHTSDKSFVTLHLMRAISILIKIICDNKIKQIEQTAIINVCFM